MRRFHGGTVNDVVLATVTGAPAVLADDPGGVGAQQPPAARMVPMGVLDDDLEPTSLGSQVAGNVLALPIGEPSPVVRLHQVSYALKAHKDTGARGLGAAADRRRRVRADHLPRPRRAGGRGGPRGRFNLVVTNVPGPQFPLYAAGARMLESYPVQPLLPDHALAIGVTSYDGAVHYGITADRDAIPDVDVIGQCMPSRSPSWWTPPPRPGSAPRRGRTPSGEEPVRGAGRRVFLRPPRGCSPGP